MNYKSQFPTTSYFTPEQMSTAITFLAYCDYRLVEIPHIIPPPLSIISYRFIFAIRSSHSPLITFHNTKMRSKYAATTSGYPRLQSNTHPHIKLILQLISYYTNISQNELLRLVNVPLGRALREGQYTAIMQYPENFVAYVVANTQISNYFVAISLFTIIAFMSAWQYVVSIDACHVTLSMRHSMLTSCIPKIIIQSDTHQLMTFLPTPDFPNPNTEKVDLLIQHFPLIRYTVEQNRQITQKHIQKALQDRHPPAIEDGRPG